MESSPPSVPLFDLERQLQEVGPALDEAWNKVRRHGRFILGPEVAEWEAHLSRTFEVSGAVGVSSGSDALLVALQALGVGPGDEVVTTPLSFFATVGAIVRVGAIPRFVDVTEGTWGLAAPAVAERLTPKVRAVLAVHLFGYGQEPEALARLCREQDVALIEDCAQSYGARVNGRPLGSFGTLSCLSFFPSKPLGALGDGGAVLAQDPALVERARRLRAHGARGKFLHEEIGGNFRLDTLQAALLLAQAGAAERWRLSRARVAERYLAGLAALPLKLPPADGRCESAWALFTIQVPGGQRDALKDHLGQRGIGTEVYYPRPLHLQPALAQFHGEPGMLPVAERFCDEALSLPCFHGMTEEEVERVIAGVQSFRWS